MKLYKIWQDINDEYDTFDSAVVVANSEVEAAHMHPNDDNPLWYMRDDPFAYMDWVHPKDVKVEYIGEPDPKYTEKCVIVASFNAG